MRAETRLLGGRYQIIRELGKGGMGVVYLAHDLQMKNEKVAIKKPGDAFARDEKAVSDLMREAQTAKNLTHDNIVAIRNFVNDDSGLYLVMDYVDGQTLDQYLRVYGADGQVTSRRLNDDELLKLLTPIAIALDYAHRKGVVHRDIKPSNVMIGGDGVVKIMDFGIARQAKDYHTAATRPADASGTLLYMSPEQLNGEDPAPAQDIYSFGAMIYQCIAGNPPFYRGDVGYQVRHAPAPSLASLCQYRGGFSQVVAEALSKLPKDRPVSCCAVLGLAEASGRSRSNRLLAGYLAASLLIGLFILAAAVLLMPSSDIAGRSETKSSAGAEPERAQVLLNIPLDEDKPVTDEGVSPESATTEELQQRLPRSQEAIKPRGFKPANPDDEFKAIVDAFKRAGDRWIEATRASSRAFREGDRYDVFVERAGGQLGKADLGTAQMFWNAKQQHTREVYRCRREAIDTLLPVADQWPVGAGTARLIKAEAIKEITLLGADGPELDLFAESVINLFNQRLASKTEIEKRLEAVWDASSTWPDPVEE